MPVASSVLVAMADIHVLKGTGQFTCLGLGSCVGLCALDPVSKVAAMAHIMLPEAFPDRPVDKPGKFADTGVKEFLRLLEAAGASRSRLKIAMGGGAQVFKFGSECGARMDIGRRNVEAVNHHLRAANLSVVAQEVGGNNGRTMIFTVETGNIRVRTVSQGEKDLCNLAA